MKKGSDNDRPLVTGDTQEEYRERLKDWTDFWKPATYMERNLVHKIAMHEWLVERLLQLQEQLLTKNDGEPAKEISTWLRSQASHEQSFYQSIAAMRETREFAQQEANGFVLQKGKKAQKEDPHQGNPWMQPDLDPFNECGWVDPITGKFTSFGDGFASEVAAEKDLQGEEQSKDPAA